MRYIEHLAIQEAYDIREREFVPPFKAMFALALSIHLLVLLIWSLFPGTHPLVVPINAIQVRLGGSEDVSKQHAAQQAAEMKKKLTQKKTAPKPLPLPKKQNDVRKQAKVNQPKPQPRRQLPPPTVSPGIKPSVTPALSAGSKYGNAATGQQIVERYTRQLSLEVQTYAKNIRLTEELKRRTAGKQVVVQLALVIGADGRLLRYMLERSSGFNELDSAAINAAIQAAPYPPPPAEYRHYKFIVPIFVD